MALIPPHFPDCVVAIGVRDKDGEYQWIGSGFLYGNSIGKHKEGQNAYSVYLVTNRHVLEKFKEIFLLFNPKDEGEPARGFRLPLYNKQGEKSWVSHPDSEIDVAVIPINIQHLQEQEMQANVFYSDTHVADIEKLNELGITEGDFVYVLGFPMGIIGSRRNTVIVRNGVIARIRDALARTNKEYLVDAFVFPGNSGGPVVSKPEMTTIRGTKGQSSAYLIGIVRSYIPYREEAISKQTGKTRITFEENSGLASVHPIDFVKDAIDEYEKTQKKG